MAANAAHRYLLGLPVILGLIGSPTLLLIPLFWYHTHRSRVAFWRLLETVPISTLVVLIFQLLPSGGCLKPNRLASIWKFQPYFPLVS